MTDYPEAVTAAGNALRKHWQTDKPGIYEFDLDPMTWAEVAVDAAAPLIAAAERDRIRQLARELKITLTRPGNGPGHIYELDFVPLLKLEDLLTEGDTT